jgi:hypothetical protein
MLPGGLLDLSHFEERRFLGEWQFGRVCSGVEKSTGREVAIKHLKVPLSPDVLDQRSFIRKPFIGFNISKDPNTGQIIVTDLMPNGSLCDALTAERSGTGLPSMRHTAPSGCSALLRRQQVKGYRPP